MTIPADYTDPVLVAKYIQHLASELDLLTWIEEVYPLVQMGVDAAGQTFPIVYRNDGTGENFDLRPDSNKYCYCFFELEGDVAPGVETDNFADEPYTMRIPVGIVFWGQLDKIYPHKRYDYSQELVKDVLKAIRTAARTPGYDIDRVTTPTVKYEGVWDKYTAVSLAETQADMRMNFTFRVDFEILTDVECLDD